jgi:hypothetical protein
MCIALEGLDARVRSVVRIQFLRQEMPHTLPSWCE